MSLRGYFKPLFKSVLFLPQNQDLSANFKSLLKFNKTDVKAVFK